MGGGGGVVNDAQITQELQGASDYFHRVVRIPSSGVSATSTCSQICTRYDHACASCRKRQEAAGR